MIQLKETGKGFWLHERFFYHPTSRKDAIFFFSTYQRHRSYMMWQTGPAPEFRGHPQNFDTPLHFSTKNVYFKVFQFHALQVL